MLRQTINKSNLGCLNMKKTVFLLCDVQESFRPAMKLFGPMVTNIQKLVMTGKVMKIPLLATEQYPEKLGHTAKEIDIQHVVGLYSKTKFSMCTNELLSKLNEFSCGDADNKIEHIVLFGIEAHICVEQTAMDLRSLGFDVHVVADCTISRSLEDRMLAFERLKQIGCFVTTSESVIFKLLKDKNHSSFNDVRKLVANTSVPTELAKL